MPRFAKMAFRNMVLHRAKSLIVGGIIAAGTFILVVGLSLTDSASRALEDSFVRDLTGDVVIVGKAGGEVSLFGALSMGGTEATPVLPRRAEILDYLSARPEIIRITSQVVGAGQLTVEGKGREGGTAMLFFFGIEPEGYRKMFDGIEIKSGAFLEPGEAGILLSVEQVDELERQFGTRIEAGSPILVQNFGSAVRLVTVRGIFEPRREGPALSLVSFIDARTLRELQGMDGPPSLPSKRLREEGSRLLGVSLAEGELFGGEGGLVEPGEAQPEASLFEARAAPPAGAEAWNCVLARTEDRRDAPRLVADLNAFFDERGIDARAEGWKEAAGPFAVIPGAMRALLSLGAIVIAVVGIIIVMNTLTTSAMERTREIGTMRALGASKGFVRILLFTETLAIGAAFGALGMALGAAAIGVMNLVGLRPESQTLQLLMGGPLLRPSLSPWAIMVAAAAVAAVSFLANLYPSAVALGIQPVAAIGSESSE
jgi:putative ABC transport system permease protein